MYDRYPRRLRRPRSFEVLESKQLLAAVVASPAKAIQLTPQLTSGDWSVDFPGDRLDAQASARRFLATIAEEISIRSDTSDLILAEVKHGLASSHVRFRQSIGGIFVEGATVTVNLGAEGSIQNFYATTFAELSLPSTAQGGLTFNQAEALARETAAVEIESSPSLGTLVWLPLREGSARLAWRIETQALRPVGDFVTLIDAQSGQVYSQRNRVEFDSGTGQVFLPNPYQTQGDGIGLADNNDANSTRLTNERVNVTLQGLNPGTGLLKGEYADLATLNSPFLSDVDANQPTRVYNYTRDDPRFEQVVVYHAFDSIQRYFQSLGFSDSNAVPNGIRDFPTLANAHWDTEDQSFYIPSNDSIRFGDGDVDDAEDADIVIHEYGHAVQHNQNQFWGGGEMDAMGEGFGDYLAASFYAQAGDPAYQATDAACVGEWDSVPFGGNPPCLRRVDGVKLYPGDLVGQEHDDGEIWSAALWNLRAAIGPPAADALVLEHHFGLPPAANMPTAALAIVAADANLNGGANEQPIRQAFCNQGILAGEECGPVLPPGQLSGVKWHDLNGDGVRDAGEPGLQNWQIYLDDNQNGLRDSYTGTRASADVPRSINDLQTTFSTLTVSGVPGVILDLNLTLDISHTYDDDLIVRLEAPSGERITLISGVGGSGNNFTNTILDDQASLSIESGAAPFAGSFRPKQPLATFNGLPASGIWTLTVSDEAPGDIGSINSWSLTFGTLELATLTDAAGQYTLSVPVAGTYTVAETPQTSWVQTFPVGGTHSVTIAPGEVVEQLNFGNQLQQAAEVVGRHVFYNNSAFDGNDPAATAADSLAIAADKVPLLWGETASFANFSSYVRGLNGVIVDIANLAEPAQLSAADFEFRAGNDDIPGDWPLAANPSISVATGAGQNGSDRITLIWPDGTLINQWLQVQVKATAHTGLLADDVFFFGNALGETDPLAGAVSIDATDFQAIRLNPRSFLTPALIENRYDLNRDKRVNALDLLIVREYQSSLEEILNLIVPSM